MRWPPASSAGLRRHPRPRHKSPGTCDGHGGPVTNSRGNEAGSRLQGRQCASYPSGLRMEFIYPPSSGDSRSPPSLKT